MTSEKKNECCALSRSSTETYNASYNQNYSIVYNIVSGYSNFSVLTCTVINVTLLIPNKDETGIRLLWYIAPYTYNAINYQL